jgi:hypothetical protein
MRIRYLGARVAVAGLFVQEDEVQAEHRMEQL